MEKHITDLFVSIIREADSLDMAEAEFRRALVDDEQLRREYRAYCKEIGTSEKNGFMDFCEEYMSDQDDVWQNLSNYDDE